MASCQTARWVTTAPYMKLDVTISSNTAITATLAWTLYYISDYPAEANPRSYTVTLAGETVKSGTYAINGKTGTYTVASGTKVINKTTASQSIGFGISVAMNLTWSGVYEGTVSASGNISVSAKTSYTVSYDANGGSGAPSAQTKWHGTNLSLSTTAPSRTGYIFQGWGTSSGGSVVYSSGATYSANATVRLYAVWKVITYTVSYDANGGSGAPGNQTKTYGVTLTLSTTIPTRTNYNFLGWSTTSNATTATYKAGGQYTTNVTIKLYAVWELAYVKPRINSLYYVVDGNLLRLFYNFECDRAPSTHMVEWTDKNGELQSEEITVTIASGTRQSIDLSYDRFSAEYTYEFTVIVNDGGGLSKMSVTMGSSIYPIDVKPPSEPKNLIPYPYVDTTKTLNGITYTDNGDGSVTVNGTATASSSFSLTNVIDDTSIVADKTYTLSKTTESFKWITFKSSGCSDVYEGGDATSAITTSVDQDGWVTMICNGGSGNGYHKIYLNENYICTEATTLRVKPLRNVSDYWDDCMTFANYYFLYIIRGSDGETIQEGRLTETSYIEINAAAGNEISFGLYFDDSELIFDVMFAFCTYEYITNDTADDIPLRVLFSDVASYLAPATFTVTETILSSMASFSIEFIIDSGQTFDNVTVYPQLELGSKVTEYQPYTAKKEEAGVAIGGTAELSGVLDIGYKTRTKGGYLYPILPDGVNLDTLLTPNTYASTNRETSNYVGAPAALSGTFTLEILSAGAEGQIMQRITQCNKADPLEFIRLYYQKTWGNWIRKYPVTVFSGAEVGEITLSESAANFKAIDIFFTDNNNLTGGYTRIYAPNEKTVCLSIIEAGSGATTYIRRTKYTISGTSITPDLDSAGYARMTGTTLSHTAGTNYIKIIRVMGYDSGTVM